MVMVNKNIIIVNQPNLNTAPYTGIHAHSTGNIANALNEIAYLKNKSSAGKNAEGIYTHIVDGKTGDVYQVGLINQGCWDIGGIANKNTYAAVELTENATTQDEFNIGYQAYLEVLVYLANEAGVGVNLDDQQKSSASGIMTHVYAAKNGWGTNHADPYNYLNKWGIDTQTFRQDLLRMNQQGGLARDERRKQLAIDGYFGPETNTRWQQIMHTIEDGIISSQPTNNRRLFNGNVNGIEFIDNAVGSSLIVAVQKYLKLTQTGIFDAETIRALEHYFGTVEDGIVSSSSAMVKALQIRLNQNYF